MEGYLKCENTKQETWNGGKAYKASRLGGLERVRGGEKVIIRARKRKDDKSICSSRLSRSCFTLSHELMSRVWPVRRSFLTKSTVVSVSIREIAYTVSQETIHGFQQIHCQRANNHHYCEDPNLARNKKTPEGVYAGCLGVRKNYQYVQWQWKGE